MNKRLRQIIVAILVLLVVITGLPWLLVWAGTGTRDGGTAHAALTAAQFTSLYDRDIVFFDQGNTYYGERNFGAAVDNYTQADAITTAAHRCMIRFNWGLALFNTGDQSTDRTAARSAYSEALRVIALRECQDSPEYGVNFAALYQALLKRLQQLDESPSSSSQQQSDGDNAAEDIIKDNSQESQQSQSYQNDRRYDQRSAEGNGDGNYNFVW